MGDHGASPVLPDRCSCAGGSLQYLLLKWFLDDSIADSKFASRQDKTAHSTAPLQYLPGPSANGLFHPRAGIARSFDEDVHVSNSETLPDQAAQSDAAHDDLAPACPRGYRSLEEMPHFFQHFSLDQGELSITIATRPPIPLQAIVRLSRHPLDGFGWAITLAYEMNRHHFSHGLPFH